MKRYNMPHRSRVVKTRLTDEEYADFPARLAPYGMSQSEFIRQAITRATIKCPAGQTRQSIYSVPPPAHRYEKSPTASLPQGFV